MVGCGNYDRRGREKTRAKGWNGEYSGAEEDEEVKCLSHVGVEVSEFGEGEAGVEAVGGGEMNLDEELEMAEGEDRTEIEWSAISMARSLHKIARELTLIRGILGSQHQLSRMELTIMPATIAVGQVATATLLGFDQNGNTFSIPSTATISPSASTPGDVSFGPPVFNADGSVSIPVAGVNPDTGDTITAVVNGITSSSDILTITSGGGTPVLTTVNLTLSSASAVTTLVVDEAAREKARLKATGQN